MEDADGHEGVALVADTSIGVVPGEECSQETKDTAGLLQAKVSGSGHSTRVCEMGAGEEEEADVEGEEEEEEHDGRLHGAKEEDEGEDEPAHEVEAKSIVPSGTVELSVNLIGGNNVEPRDLNHSPANDMLITRNV